MLIWSEEYAIHEPSIDELHKKLFDLTNKLTKAIEEGDNVFIADLFDTLEMYTLYHFSGEEHVMNISNYPLLNEHEALHQELTKQFHDFKDKYSHKNIEDFSTIKAFLESWLRNHILKEDLKFGKYLKENKLNKN
ncbi:MAG: hemerythrin family protein [Nitrospinae bacterium]|nr:hemerythrin family protein [Nitrospinota bacterium]